MSDDQETTVKTSKQTKKFSLLETHSNEEATKTQRDKKRKKSKRSRKDSLDRLNWEVRARCDVKLMWQISIGEGLDICPGQQEYLYENDWTPTEEDFKLFEQRKDECSQEFSRFSFTPRPFQETCGKDNCFFEDGSILYL